MFRDKINIGDLFCYRENPKWTKRTTKYYFVVLGRKGSEELEILWYRIHWFGKEPNYSHAKWNNSSFMLSDDLRKKCTRISKNDRV